jgi:phosphatidylglycerophosphate synthase
MESAAVVAPGPRRAIALRNAGWAQALARKLSEAGVSPNTISLASIVCAGLAAGALVAVPYVPIGVSAGLLLLTALGIQLRLLANLLDGLVAIEGGRATRIGPLFNEIPDRVSDALVLFALGYATASAAGPSLGWLAALLAIGTAYVRLLGGTLLGTQSFAGPLAKPQRMAVVTGACILAAALLPLGVASETLMLALWVVIIGSAYTLLRRTRDIGARLD